MRAASRETAPLTEKFLAWEISRGGCAGLLQVNVFGRGGIAQDREQEDDAFDE